MERRRFVKTVALAQGALALAQQPPFKGKDGNMTNNDEQLPVFGRGVRKLAGYGDERPQGS
jgi:hypothetical protein